MSVVKIVPPNHDGKINTGLGLKVFNSEGSEIYGVATVDVSFRPGEAVNATIGLAAAMDECNAEILLDECTLRRSAEALGFDLVKKG